MQAGMVHALKEIHRVLKSGGTLIDLRPHYGNRAIEVDLSSATLHAGEIDSSRTESDKHAADSAIQQVVQDGLFKLEHDEIFELQSHLDTVDDLREMRKSFRQSILPDEVITRVEALTADETDDFSIRVRRNMLIARYRRL